MFIRVKDKITGHQYDVHVQSFNESKHERLKRFPPSRVARPAKPHIKRARAPKETSTPEVVEGVSPASE